MRGKGWAGAITALTVAAFTGVTIMALIAPNSPPAQILARLLPLAEPHAAAAEHAMSQGNLVLAKAETKSELEVSPIREAAWLRLVRIDIARHGRLSPEGVEALSHAYDAVPYDLNPDSQRIPLVLDQFGAVPASLRFSVMDELRVWASSPLLRRRLLTLAAETGNPATQGAIRTLTNPPVLD